MVKILADFLLKDIAEDVKLKQNFAYLLTAYLNYLVDHRDVQYNDNFQLLLQYADLLSLSNQEQHQNIAQQIVILLSQLFPKKDTVNIVKENIYKNVSNFASIDLLLKNNKLAKISNEFMHNVMYTMHRIENNIPDSDKSFFDAQKTILSSLETNQYYSFSAPTSMGKTFVSLSFIRNMLKQNSRDNFAIIVPTRALLSEIANKIINDFKDYLGNNRHKVVTTTAVVQEEEKFIAVLTPERLYYSLLKKPEVRFKYIFIDEAHKISGNDKRSIIYYKILDMFKTDNNIHIYFSSPIIPNPDIYLELTNFYSNSNSSGKAFVFSPVIQNKIYFNFLEQKIQIYNNITNEILNGTSFPHNITDKMQALLFFGKNKCNLIYVSSANKAIKYALELANTVETYNLFPQTDEVKKELEKASKQIEQKIHQDYYLAKLIRQGIAYHIGALPGEVRTQIEDLLRKGYLQYCFCTSTLLEGVNVPVDNLFIFDSKKGRSEMSAIDAFNLIGRAGRVTLNEYGNAFIIIEDNRTQQYFNKVLLNPLPHQDLLPQKTLQKKHKKHIVSVLLNGKTNLLEEGEKYSSHGFNETTYEYATKCLNMLLQDICTKNKSYIVKDFEKDEILSPQNIIDIRSKFSNFQQDDNDINLSAIQKNSLYDAVLNKNINYPNSFDYQSCLCFLKELSEIFQWPIYERTSLGRGESLKYYTVILTQWMQGKGLHEIIRSAINYYREHSCQLQVYDPTYRLVDYNDSLEHKNIIINETMKNIEEIINYKFSMYFLRLSETLLKLKGESVLINDWYEYVEYGTNNHLVITLQKYGFLREEAISLISSQYIKYFNLTESHIQIDIDIINIVPLELKNSIQTVMINYPEIFYTRK